ncbi:50S ribosomal protein L21 [Mollicutes bacterium LVI A0078]|nr:50S ribosomal protein L21 [Mollicutes bacterium LVI A0075]WOO91765.1 50S ribosomal protein L21 [Mollicutes bacterium LVI A0078]
MNAIIKTGGKQYRVEEGREIFVEKLAGEAGDTVTFDEVIMVGDKIGTPFVDGAKVEGEIVKQGKGKKITIFKFKAKKDYRNKKGHRQQYTKVKITNIAG